MKRTACDTSPAVPKRRNGTCLVHWSTIVCESASRVLGVSMKPGATAQMRIPNAPSYLLHVTVIASKAALAAV